MENVEKKESASKHELTEFARGKAKPPKKMGHSLTDKRPHFKSFKSPGVK